MSKETRDPLLLQPTQSPRWLTLEFLLYLTAVTGAVVMFVWETHTLSTAKSPIFVTYQHLLSPGWLWPDSHIDNSDLQFRGFRNNVPLLAIAVIAHVLLTRGLQFCGLLVSPESRLNMSIGVGLLFVTALHGTSVIFIAFILLVSFAISQLFKGHWLNPLLTWLWILSVLFCNEHFRGYQFQNFHSSLAVLDNYRGVMRQWHVLFNISALRLISYNMDYYWKFSSPADVMQKHRLVCDRCNEDHLNDKCEKAQVQFPLPRWNDYSFRNYLSYCLYAPLFLAGPIITYNGFISQFRQPTVVAKDGRAIMTYALRLAASMLLMEFLLHYMHVVAISKVKIWNHLTPAQICLVGYWNLFLIWLKLMIIWRFFRLWALLDGIDPPENMIRCMNNNYSAVGFWRSWHRSYNRWLIRYIYVPLGGAKYQLLNNWVIFTFVALWHDLSLNLLAWGWLICLFLLPEIALTYIFSLEKMKNIPYRRHICAAGAALNIYLMIIANLVGFAVGVDGMQSMLKAIFTLEGSIPFWFGFFIFYCAAHVMFEIREDERRKTGIESTY